MNRISRFKPVAFDEPKNIKSMIKEYKAMCEIKRSDIADYLGITDDTLKTWETGKYRVAENIIYGFGFVVESGAFFVLFSSC